MATKLIGGGFGVSVCRLMLLVPGLVSGWADWRAISTTHFEVFHKPGYDSAAFLAARMMERYHPFVSGLTGNTIQRTRVRIEDIGSLANGMTDPVFGTIALYTYPPEPWSEIGFSQSWWRQVAVHEYIHMAHLRNTGGMPALLVSIMGTLFYPNLLSPGWITEGITVLGESQLSPYEGRLNDGFFDAYVAARAAEKSLPSLADATYLPFEYPYLTGSYLFGGKFFGYLAERSGSDRFARFFTENGSAVSSYCNPLLPSIGFDRLTPSCFNGVDFVRLYHDWTRLELARHQNWRIPGEQLTQSGGTILGLTAEQDKLYYVREERVKSGAARAFSWARIIERSIATGTERTVVTLVNMPVAPVRVYRDRLYYAALDLAPGYANTSNLGLGVVANLHERNLTTGGDRVIMRDRLRCFAVLDDGRIVYARDRKAGFGSELMVYCPRTGSTELLFTADLLVGDLVAQGKRVVAVARPDWENWNIYLLDTEAEVLRPIVTTPWKEANPSLSHDRLLFSANYDRVYTVWLYDFDSGSFFRLTESGFADSPVLDETRGELYFVGLNSRGNDLYRTRLVLGTPVLPPETLKNEVPELPVPDLKHHGYARVLPSMLPVIHIPLVLPADTTFRQWVLGGLVMGSDVTGEHTYEADLLIPVGNAAHSGQQTPVVDFGYYSYFFAPMSATVQMSNQPPLLDVSAGYPLLVHPDWALNRLTLGLEAALFDPDFTRRALIPRAEAQLAVPGFELGIGAGLLIERRLWGAQRNSHLFDIALAFRKYLHQSELRLHLEAVAADQAVPLVIRGYGTGLKDACGGTASAEVSMPLLRIRKGWWNPNLYFEDLCGSLFCDAAFGSSSGEHAFLGMELQLESGVAFLSGARLLPKCGVGINSELQVRWYLGLDVGSWLSSGVKASHTVTNRLIGKREGRLLKAGW